MNEKYRNRVRDHFNTISAVGVLVVLSIFFNGIGSAQLDFDRNKFKAELTRKLEGHINKKLEKGIWDLINRGEQIADKQIYLRDQLQPLVDAGILKNTDNISKQAYDLYLTYRDSPDRKQQLMDDLQNKVHSMFVPGLDKESSEIVSSLQSLWNESMGKLNKIVSATDQIQSMPDADYVKILKDNGLSGSFIDKLENMEVGGRAYIQDLTGGRLSPEDMYKMYTIIRTGMESKNPGHKIDALFSLGAEFGGKIPILGKFVELYFKVAQEMNRAVGRLGRILRDRQQGCVGTGTTGHISSSWEDIRSKQFASQFPGQEACPAENRVGIYKDIYLDQNSPDFIYFWVGGKFIKGLPHGGFENLKAIIRWLRGNEHHKKASDISFLAAAYNIPPGFTALKQNAEKTAGELQTEVRRIVGSLLCGKEKVQQFLLLDLGLGSIIRKIGMDQDLVTYFPFTDALVNKIIEERLFKKADHYAEGSFHRECEDAITRLKNTVAATIEGTVLDGSGKGMPGMDIEVTPSGKVFENCSRLTSTTGGTFRVVVLKSPAESFTLSLRAVSQDVTGEEKSLTLSGKKTTYTIELTVEKPGVKSLTITPVEAEIKIKQTVGYTATAELEDGTVKTIPRKLIKWGGAEKGIFTGTKSGTFTVTASYGDAFAQAQVTVEEEEEKDLDEVIDDIEGDKEEGEDPCDPIVIKAKLEQFETMKSNLLAKCNRFNAASAKFFQEINSRRSVPCDNNMVAFTYYTAKSTASEVEQLADNMKDLYSEIVIAGAICQTEDNKQIIKNLLYDFNDVGPKIGTLNRTLAAMKSKLAEFSCDEDKVSERGEEVTAQGEIDSEFLQDGGSMGEVIGDVVDQTGEGTQDEGSYQGLVVIRVWDCGSAKDDIFLVSLSGYPLGRTPKGARKLFAKELKPGKSYTVTITTEETEVGAGTWAVKISYNGQNLGGTPVSGNDTGAVPFTVPEKD